MRTRAFRYQLQRWGGREELEIERELQQQVADNEMYWMNNWSDGDDDIDQSCYYVAE